MTTILIKKKDTAGAPAPGDLTNAAGGTEIAVNTATKRIYTKDSGGNVVELGTNPSALTGNLLFSPDNTYDIGASGTSRPRSLFLGTNITVGSLTSTRVPYASTGGLLVDSANMTFNGTKLTVAGFLDSALTSGRVPYATTSGELTDSANLLYSGTDLTVYGITVGRGAGAVSTNTAVGASALAANTTGANHAAFGKGALYSNTTGAEHTAVGVDALNANTTGNYNVAMGVGAAKLNTTGSNNTALGYLALLNNTTASNNTAVGYQAGYSNTTGTANAFFGRQAGYSMTAGDSTLIGDYAGQATTGASNTFVGSGAGYLVTTGGRNTIIGRFGGNSGGLDIRTASNYIVLSDGDGNPQAYHNGTSFYVNSIANSGSLRIAPKNTTVGTSATTVSPIGSDFGSIYIVSGNSGGNIFTDLIFSATTGGPTVISAKTVSGGPAGRTYTMSSGYLQLAMGSGSYAVNCAVYAGT